MKTFFFILVLFCTNVANAREMLVYTPPSDDFRDRIIVGYIQKNYPDIPAPLTFARTDLNGDGVPEYLATSAKNPSKHVILGLRRRQVTEMGKMTAQKLEISDKKTYGVRDLLVYNQPRNDFFFELWVWRGNMYGLKPAS
jgi:hypothetical protein